MNVLVAEDDTNTRKRLQHFIEKWGYRVITAKNGLEALELSLSSDTDILVTDWTPDGRLIAYSSVSPQGSDIIIIPLDPDTEPFPYMQTTNFGEWDAQFSPDGRWIAFSSDESTEEEVYVASFPGPGGKWQVSQSQGDRPIWSPDGRTIFYLDNEDRVTSAAVEISGGALKIGQVKTRFSINGQRPGNIFCLMDGGQRILVNQAPVGGDNSLIVLIQNWSQDIGR